MRRWPALWPSMPRGRRGAFEFMGIEHPLPLFQVYECSRPDCQFRFSAEIGQLPAEQCPRCGRPTQAIGLPYSNYEVGGQGVAPAGTPMVALLDNIRSTFNVGAIFRTADGVGLAHLYLCGITATPDHSKVRKTALGAEQTIAWSYHPNAIQVARDLQAQNYRLWAIEGHPQAKPLPQAASLNPIALIVGNELSGVDPGLLAIADQIFYIPMQGHKRSLNVAIAFSIAAYLLHSPH